MARSLADDEALLAFFEFQVDKHTGRLDSKEQFA